MEKMRFFKRSSKEGHSLEERRRRRVRGRSPSRKARALRVQILECR